MRSSGFADKVSRIHAANSDKSEYSILNCPRAEKSELKRRAALVNRNSPLRTLDKDSMFQSPSIVGVAAEALWWFQVYDSSSIWQNGYSLDLSFLQHQFDDLDDYCHEPSLSHS